MNLLFICHLILTTLILFMLFNGYKRIVEEYFPPLSGIPWGFIGFIAANQLLALPFLIFHLSFVVFLACFLFLNIPFLLIGIFTFIHRFKRPKILFSDILALLLVGVCIFVTQVFVSYGADDAFYLSLVEQHKHSDSLYKTDPATGNDALPISQTYLYQSWELILAVFSKLLIMQTSEIAHSLIPIIIVIISFSTHKMIFRRLLKNSDKTNYALMYLGFLFLLSGYSTNSQGTFLLTRSWTGKAIIASVLIPLSVYLFYRLYSQKYDHKYFYLGIFMINIAAVALNPSAVFIFLSLMLAMTIVLMSRYKWKKVYMGSLLASIPLLLAALGSIFIKYFDTTTIKNFGIGSNTEVNFTFYLERFVGSSWFFYIVGLSIAVYLYVHFIKSSRNKFLLFMSFYIGILALTALNPLLFKFIETYATSTTYWRLYWLVPITLLIPYIAVISSEKIISIISTRLIQISKYKLAPIAHILFIGALILGGSFVIDTTSPIHDMNTSTTKTPPNVSWTVEKLDKIEDGKILASSRPAIYFHNFTTKHELLVSRELYLPLYYDKTSVEFMELTKLQQAMDNKPTIKDTKELSKLLHKYEVDYLIYRYDNNLLIKYAHQYQIEVLFFNDNYVMAKTK